MTAETFTDEQQQYLQGFVAGSGLAHKLPTFSGTLGLPDVKPPHGVETAAGGPQSMHRAAQDRFIAAGKKLCPEEQSKRESFPLDLWDRVVQHAREGKFPKGGDVLAFKYQGMFYVAPAQDSFMCRLRIHGGMSSSFQFRGFARLADDFGGGFTDVTTRANLQIRQIKPFDTVAVLEGLCDLGIIARGSGADNIRNITASPTAGIDRQELIDTRPLARAMHYHILNHREMYGLPRKFNIAFDGGGCISALEDTNDIGFTAIAIGSGKAVAPGVYFRLTLGGITGHKDFARDTGIIVKSDECIAVAAAIVRVFIDNGDRTDRKKARLKYVLDQHGFEWFIEQTEKHLGYKLTRFPLADCEPRPSVMPHGHVGFHVQKQPGLYYVGVVLPVGRMTGHQMRGLADIADRHGSGSIRLTVWQNLLISDIPAAKIQAVKEELEAIGLHWSASSVRGALVACTGNAGCKYANANTKKHGLEITDYLDSRLTLDTPVNIHVTGCHHSCAQHYIGDIGLLGTKVELGDDMVEGYHIFIGGGYGQQQNIGRQIYTGIIATDAPAVIERMLRGYQDHRHSAAESFHDFTKRHDTEKLLNLFEHQPTTV
jgi:ferredoxin-nitrite reductase